MFHLGKQFIILIICGCVFLLSLIIGIIVFLNKPKPNANANPINTFVAVGEGSDTIAWSDDGKIWNKIAPGSGFNQRGTCVTSNGKVWVAGGEESPGSNAKNMVFSKDNARTWAPVNPPLGNNRNDIVNALVWDGTNFIAVGLGFSGGTTAVWSEDGQKWNSSTGDYVVASSESALALFALGCNQEICVALSYAPSCVIIFSENNGKLWTNATGDMFSDNTGVFGSFVTVNDKKYWVAIAKKSTTTNILCSYNGKKWTTPRKNIFNDANIELYCVAHDNGSNWVVVGNKGIGFSSDNGETWELATGGDFTTDSFYSVVYNGKIWVATGSVFILYSSDGIKWTKSDTINSDSENHLCWNGTVWVYGGFGLQTPAIRWSEDVTKTWNLTSFNKVSDNLASVVHDIACRYKV
jgi:hypothetical protein